MPDQVADADHQVLHQSQGVDEQDRKTQGRAEEALCPAHAEQPERQEKNGAKAQRAAGDAMHKRHRLTVATAKKRIRAISATWVFGDMGSPSSPSLRDYPRRISSQPRGASRPRPRRPSRPRPRPRSIMALPVQVGFLRKPFRTRSAPPRRAAHAEPAAPEALHDSMRSPQRT